MAEAPKARDYMASEVLTLRPDLDIYAAVAFLVENRISGAPVVDGAGTLLGIISEKDCLKVIAKGADHRPADGTVADFMTKEVETLPPDMDIYFATGRFLAASFRRFPVVEDGRLVGQISRRDVLRAIEAIAREHAALHGPVLRG